MGRRHTKTDIVVEVVDVVVVAVRAAGVPAIVVERPATNHAAALTGWPCARLAGASALYPRFLAPAAQDFADLDRHFTDMLVLAQRDEFQIDAHADINLQLAQADIGLLQMARPLDPQSCCDDLLLELEGFVLDAFRQDKTLVFGKFLRGRQKPED
jgi:hypothetical protein